MDVIFYTQYFWYWYTQTIETLAFHREWLFVIYSVPAMILIAWGPFSVVRLFANGSSDYNPIKSRWRLVLIAPALFFVVPSITLDFYIVFGSKVKIQTEWVPQSYIWAQIASISFFIGFVWGVVRTAISKGYVIIGEGLALSRQLLSERQALEKKRLELRKELSNLD